MKLRAGGRTWAIVLCAAGGAVLGVAAYRATSLVLRPRERPNIILLSLDALRPDRLGCYGSPHDTSPSIDALARDGVLFENAYTQSNWTLPSHMSTLLSLYPTVHGVKTPNDRMDPRFVTLPELLRRHGYRTAGFVDGGYLSACYGFRQGFDVYEDEGGRRARTITKRAIGFIDAQCAPGSASAPRGAFFLFYHVFDIHGPYEAPERYVAMFYRGGDPRDPANRSLDAAKAMRQHDYLKFGDITDIDYVRARYDAGVRYVDEHLGELFRALKRNGIYDRTMIILTSDHGEELFEDGVMFGHGIFLAESEMRVPLIVKLPGAAPRGRREPGLASLIDVYPTVVDLLGIGDAPPMQGVSLMPCIRGGGPARGEAFGISTNMGDQSCVVAEGWKYVEPLPPGHDPHRNGNLMRHGEPATYIDKGAHLFDLRADPGTRENLAGRRGEVERGMRDRLERFKASNAGFRARHYPAAGKGGEAGLGDGLKRELNALGYLH